MVKFILFMLLAYGVFKLLKMLTAKARASGGGRARPAYTEAPRPVSEMVQDPVCKVYVPKKDAVPLVQGGSTYYFCSRNCLDSFRQRDITR